MTQDWLLGASLALASSWLFAMHVYPNWYVSNGRTGDTIGAAYANGRIPKAVVPFMVAILGVGFLWCSWWIVMIGTLAQPMAAGIHLTILRSNVQYVAPIGAVLALAAAVYIRFTGPIG